MVEKIKEKIEPVVKENGYYIDEVEYVKERSQNFLRNPASVALC